MKKISILFTTVLLMLLLVGCSQKDVTAEKYFDPEGNEYTYKLVLTDRLHNAVRDGTITIITNDNTLTYEKVMYSLLSSRSWDKEGIEYYLLPTE